MKRAEIVDRTGFEKPLVAATILVPVAWQVAGGVVWNAQDGTCGNGCNFAWEAVASDGLSGVQILPMERWQWNSAGIADPAGCPAAPITSVAQYIESLVGRARPGARMLDFRRRPDIEQELGQVITTKGRLSLIEGQQVPFVLLDVLGAAEAIPGSTLTVPAHQPGRFDDRVQQELGAFLSQATAANREIPLVFYCVSIHCWMSHNAALRAIHLGYSNVLWYRGGLEAWKAAGRQTQAR